MNAPTNSIALAPAKLSLVDKFASKFSIEPAKLLPILKATAFKQRDGEPEVTNEQMGALLIVADQYTLNPFTKEIYAFPDKNNGIVPVVSVDGWNRIVQDHPQFDGFEFRYSEDVIDAGDARFKGLKYRAHDWMEVAFYRKDVSRPIVIREYFEEVYRPPFEKGTYVKEGPWQSHDKRMHRHKTFIQGARMAFGFAGIYDEDEAQRILEKDMGTVEVVETPKTPQRKSRREAAEAPANPPSAKAETPAAGTPNLATKDEVEFVKMKLEALGVSVEDACAEAGLSSIENLSPDGYLALRDVIREREKA